MAAGDIVRTHAFDVKQVTIKVNEDIAKGEVINNLSGTLDAFEQAEASAEGPVMVALETRVYATDTAAGKEHTMNAMFSGIVEVKKVAGVIPKGVYIEISTTPGSVTKQQYSSFPIGIADEDAATGDTTVKIRLRC